MALVLVQVQHYKRRLELLAEGRLVEAMQIVTGGNSATAKAVDKMDAADAAGKFTAGGLVQHVLCHNRRRCLQVPFWPEGNEARPFVLFLDSIGLLICQSARMGNLQKV